MRRFSGIYAPRVKRARFDKTAAKSAANRVEDSLLTPD